MINSCPAVQKEQDSGVQYDEDNVSASQASANGDQNGGNQISRPKSASQTTEAKVVRRLSGHSAEVLNQSCSRFMLNYQFRYLYVLGTQCGQIY